MARTWIALAAVALTSTAVALVIWQSNDQPSTSPAYAADLARGEAIYAEACAACHGANLEGEPNWRVRGADGLLPAPPHDASGHTWHHSDRQLLEITRLGPSAIVGNGYQSAMPGFGGIYSDDELRDVLEWIKSQWPARERMVQADVTARDEAQQRP